MIRQPLDRSTISAEARLLLALAGGAQEEAAIGELLRLPLDWRYLLGLTIAEGAQPYVGRRLRELAGHEMPADVLEQIRSIEIIAEFRAHYLERRVLEVLQMLSNAGIRVVLLKGAALVFTAYRSFSERQMADIDLLIQPAQAAQARSLLYAAGWKPRFKGELDGLYAGMHHLPPLLDAQAPNLAVGLELHTDLLSPARNPFGMHAQRIWQGARTLAGLPDTVLVPNPLDLLLHCCIHYTWSHMFRSSTWRTFRDLQTILASGSIDWQTMVEEARSVRCQTCCYWTLRLANQLAGIPVPNRTLEMLQPQLPGVVLSMLERHLHHETITAESICPSRTLQRMGWEFAIRPQASGHGTARPWDDAVPWHLVHPPSAEQPQDDFRPSTSPAAWFRYARSLVPVS